MFDHCIKDRQQFAHASNQSNLWSFPCVAQPSIESSDNSIASTGDQSRHVEDSPYASSAAPDGAPSSEGAAVSVERCDADQGSNLFAIKLSEFWQLADQGGLITGPTPGTLWSKSWFSCQIGL